MRVPRTKLLSVRLTQEQFRDLEVIADARKYSWEKRGNVSSLVRMHLVQLIHDWDKECAAKTESIRQAKRMTKQADSPAASTSRKAV